MQRNNKLTFLDNNKFYPYALSARELAIIRSHYQHQNIRIVINGETSLGQSLIADNRHIVEKQIHKYECDSSKYAAYIKEHWAEAGANNVVKYKRDFSIRDSYYLSEIKDIKSNQGSNISFFNR